MVDVSLKDISYIMPLKLSMKNTNLLTNSLYKKYILLDTYNHVTIIYVVKQNTFFSKNVKHTYWGKFKIKKIKIWKWHINISFQKLLI